MILSLFLHQLISQTDKIKKIKNKNTHCLKVKWNLGEFTHSKWDSAFIWQLCAIWYSITDCFLFLNLLSQHSPITAPFLCHRSSVADILYPFPVFSHKYFYPHHHNHYHHRHHLLGSHYFKKKQEKKPTTGNKTLHLCGWIKQLLQASLILQEE